MGRVGCIDGKLALLLLGAQGLIGLCELLFERVCKGLGPTQCILEPFNLSSGQREELKALLLHCIQLFLCFCHGRFQCVGLGTSIVQQLFPGLLVFLQLSDCGNCTRWSASIVDCVSVNM